MSVSNLLADNSLSVKCKSVVADGVTIGEGSTVGTEVLSLSGLPAPAAAAAKASTHEVPITINGTVYNFLVSNV